MIFQKKHRHPDLVKDGRGKPIDPGIRSVVIGLWVHGFETDGSCEGHVDRALPYPWIDVLRKHDAEVRELLEQFNRRNQCELEVVNIPVSSSRIQPKGMRRVRVQDIPTAWSPEERLALVTEGHQVMRQFATFLRETAE